MSYPTNYYDPSQLMWPAVTAQSQQNLQQPERHDYSQATGTSRYHSHDIQASYQPFLNGAEMLNPGIANPYDAQYSTGGSWLDDVSMMVGQVNQDPSFAGLYQTPIEQQQMMPFHPQSKPMPVYMGAIQPQQQPLAGSFGTFEAHPMPSTTAIAPSMSPSNSGWNPQHQHQRSFAVSDSDTSSDSTPNTPPSPLRSLDPMKLVQMNSLPDGFVDALEICFRFRIPQARCPICLLSRSAWTEDPSAAMMRYPKRHIQERHSNRYAQALRSGEPLSNQEDAIGMCMLAISCLKKRPKQTVEVKDEARRLLALMRMPLQTRPAVMTFPLLRALIPEWSANRRVEFRCDGCGKAYSRQASVYRHAPKCQGNDNAEYRGGEDSSDDDDEQLSF